MQRHALELAARANPADLARLASAAGNQAMVQRLAAPMMVQRAPVKDTELGGKKLDSRGRRGLPRRTTWRATLRRRRLLSKGRVSRTDKNTVVLGSLSDVTTAMGAAAYSATPLLVPGVPWVKVTSLPKTAIKPEDVTSQTVRERCRGDQGEARLVADDEAKLTPSPKSDPNGPILLATGVQG